MAALVVLAWGVAGIYSVGDIPEPTNHSLGRGPSAAIVSWHDPRAEDIESLRAGLPSDVVVPLARISATSSLYDKTPVEPSNEQGQHHSAADKQKHAHDDRPAVDQSPPAAHDHSVPVRLAMGTTCAELATALGPETCSGASTLTVQGRARLVETLAKSVHEPITGIRIVRAGLPTFDSVAVLGAQSLPQLDERVRAVSMSALPAPHVDSAVFRLSRPAQTLNGWILGVAAISLGALALASLVAMVDRSLQQREQHRLLLNLGASPHALKSLGAALFGVSYAVACTVGMGIGVFVCAQMVDDGVPLPWSLINAVAAVLIILGLLGTGAMALFNARAVYRTIEYRLSSNGTGRIAGTAVDGEVA
ncbi:hypothetical protein [Nocardioides piscis]|uniref:FtsX-like permease family protein n=1 Tax=Nocardioides piscis TaxID=2714938 RepID=A0A6G7YDT7_9ACTN|nr:hypothetical protein [Nocardioides piscis]QIK74889.1 hypothetical protein G7071_05045 [Nocardioides piscis]